MSLFVRSVFSVAGLEGEEEEEEEEPRRHSYRFQLTIPDRNLLTSHGGRGGLKATFLTCICPLLCTEVTESLWSGGRRWGR